MDRRIAVIAALILAGVRWRLVASSSGRTGARPATATAVTAGGRRLRRRLPSGRSRPRCTTSPRTACRFPASSARCRSATRSSSRRGASSRRSSPRHRAPLASPIPAGTSLRALYVSDRGDAFVDLSGEVRTGHTGGSLDELFTVYAIVERAHGEPAGDHARADSRRRQGSRHARRTRRSAPPAAEEPQVDVAHPDAEAADVVR